MRLNIGCGPFFLKGYINIDPYDKRVADRFYHSWSLSYPDSSIDEIVSFQLIEHLGYAGFIFSISEWFRVLKHKGKLIIETVDLEKTLAQKPLDKNWFFGMDEKGMSHQYCFDAKEIVDLLKETGFTNIKTRPIMAKKPTLQVTAYKRQDKDKLLISQTRQLIIKNKMINPDSVSRADADYESIFKELLNVLKSKINEKEKILSLLQITASFNPKLSSLFFTLSKEKKYFPSQAHYYLEEAIEISRQLIEEKFIYYLSDLYCRIKKATGMSDVVLQRVKNASCQYIEGLFSHHDRKKILSIKLLIFKGLRPQTNILSLNHFSINELGRLSFNSEIRGIKAFAQKKYNQAKIFLGQAVGFNSDNFFSYWNLARLYLMKKDIPQAIVNYEKTFETVPKYFRQDLIKEINDVIRDNKENKYLMVKENVYH